jgi:hypothetical protein
MESVCTAIPLKPGMWDLIQQHRDELIKGVDPAEEEYGRKHRGFRVVKVFHQRVPMEALVLYFEAENLEEAFHPRHQDHETLQKRAAFWKEVAGLTEPFMSEIPQLLIDWHHQEGHRNKAATRAPKA